MKRTIELPDDILAALGRVAWGAMNLEDWTDSLCRAIVLVDYDKLFQIGKKINAAKAIIKTLPASDESTAILAWLDQARASLDARNRLLHGVPASSRDGRSGAVYVRRDRNGSSLPSIDTEIDVATLTAIAETCEAVLEGWREVFLCVNRLAGELSATAANGSKD